MNDSTPLGTFEEQVMLAVLRTGDEAYGMNVRRELESVTGRGVAIGAVYATLDRLEAKGLVASSRSGAGTASRRLFAVTAPGARALDESRIMRERLWEGVDLRPLLACLSLLLLLLLPGAALAATSASKLELAPCTGIPGLPPEARCGIYEVWENRAAKSGRKIPLRVLVIPAEGPGRQPDPLVFFNGGPGESNVNAASWLIEEIGAIRKHRDIFLVDFRGTGGTAALVCPELQGGAGPQDYLDHNLPADGARTCAERLSKTFDLTQYNNDNTVDDVDEVRAALGYEKINIYGGSGGSRTGLIYLRRHPDRVRTAVLGGLVPPDELGPFPMARHAQRALDGLIAECAGDAACRNAFPRLREEIAAVLEQAGKAPVAHKMTDGETGKPVEVRLTQSAVKQTLRSMLYSPARASRLPWSVHQAAQGNWKPLAEEAVASAAGLSGLTRGYYLSLTCSEDLPFIREDEIPAAIEGTFLGDFRIRAQQAACAVWPVPPVGREFLEPVTSDVPVLLISGERDPVTPPGNAERAARTLKNSLHVVIPDAGHNYSGLEGVKCIDDLTLKVVESGTVQGLDTSCLARIKRPEFVLKQDPDVEVPADQLARLAGTYRDRESGFEIRFEVSGDRLRATVGDPPFMVLVPTSPTRFRVEGLPGYFASFELKDGRATTCTTVEPGRPSRTLLREGS